MLCRMFSCVLFLSVLGIFPRGGAEPYATRAEDVSEEFTDAQSDDLALMLSDESLPVEPEWFFLYLEESEEFTPEELQEIEELLGSVE